MDRRSWLWRRKSSEKSPSGETESSGSLSSHSERFSDDQTLLNHNIQSPEVTSKAAPDDELRDNVKTLSGKLTEALLNIRAKEDLVEQHAKVAEEAVSGWEKAENEVSVLKKQNEALTQKNSILEERVGHLDAALKECLRQLRQAREEQEERINESKQQLSDLENAKTDANTHAAKLEAAEKENSILKLKLLSKAKELEVRTRERDLSTHAAETASKQHLDSIKRVAKLDAECRRLKARASKETDNQSVTASLSFHIESFTDSHSDNGERVRIIEDDSVKMSGLELADSQGRCSLMVPSVEIDLMDDFLEMERLASEETRSRDELEAMTNKEAELEDTIKKITAEKVNLEIALSESEIQLKASEDQLKQAEMKLVDLKTQLALANKAKGDVQREVEITKVKLNNLTKVLSETKEAKSRVEVQLEDALLKRAESESRLKVMELDFGTLHSSITTLEKEFEKEKTVSREAVAKCDILEAEISRLKSDAQFQRSAIIEEFRASQDKELAVAAGKFAECQKTIASLGRQLKSLATLEDCLIDSERSLQSEYA